MLNIARLFGKSPFAPLQSHMKKVSLCVERLSDMFTAIAKGRTDKLEKLAQELSRIEHEADITKNDIRNHLPKSLFLPIDRSHFLDILSIQDSIADKAEDISTWLILHPLEPCGNLEEGIVAFFKKNELVFQGAKHVIEEIDELIEFSFGGIEAEKVKAMVEHIAHQEWDSKKMRTRLLKELFETGASLSTPAFSLWRHLIEELWALAHLSERLANRIRMILELK